MVKFEVIMKKKQFIKFNSLKSGINRNTNCWQEIKEKVKGLGIIERHTKVEIIDVDPMSQTVVIKYMLGGFKKLNEKEFNQLKLFKD